MKMNKILILTFTSLLFLLISCSREEYTDEQINEIVQRTDSLLVKLAGQKYDWASAKAYSTVTAYYPETDIIFLNDVAFCPVPLQRWVRCKHLCIST